MLDADHLQVTTTPVENSSSLEGTEVVSSKTTVSTQETVKETTPEVITPTATMKTTGNVPPSVQTKVNASQSVPVQVQAGQENVNANQVKISPTESTPQVTSAAASQENFVGVTSDTQVTVSQPNAALDSKVSVQVESQRVQTGTVKPSFSTVSEPATSNQPLNESTVTAEAHGQLEQTGPQTVVSAPEVKVEQAVGNGPSPSQYPQGQPNLQDSCPSDSFRRGSHRHGVIHQHSGKGYGRSSCSGC